MDPITIAEMYGPPPVSEKDVDAALDRSLGPRSAESLFDTVASLGLAAGSPVLDIGARDARHSVTLHERFGFEVVAIDPIQRHLVEARRSVADRVLGARVGVAGGVIEALSVRSETMALVFCRDVLSHVARTDVAMDECARVLRPGASVVVYQTFATDLLEPAETSRLCDGLAVCAESLDPRRLERAARGAGLVLDSIDVIGSEWRESWEEDGSRRTSSQLLHAARLHRARDSLQAELGERLHRIELANALWGVYQMLGKLEPRVYVFGKPDRTRPGAAGS